MSVAVENKDYDSDGVKTVISHNNEFFKQFVNDNKDDDKKEDDKKEDDMVDAISDNRKDNRQELNRNNFLPGLKKGEYKSNREKYYKCLPCFHMSKRGRCNLGDDSCTYIHYQDELRMTREMGLTRHEYVRKYFNNFQRDCYYNLGMTKMSASVKDKVWKKVEKSIENSKYKKISIFVDKSDLTTYMKVLSILKDMKDNHEVKIEY